MPDRTQRANPALFPDPGRWPQFRQVDRVSNTSLVQKHLVIGERREDTRRCESGAMPFLNAHFEFRFAMAFVRNSADTKKEYRWL